MVTRKPRIDNEKRDREALELRRAGVTYDVIAERLWFTTRESAHRSVIRQLERTAPASDNELRQLEADRLDRLHFAVWNDALRGDPAATDRVLRISERRARLLGLDVGHTTPVAQKPSLIWEQGDDDDGRIRSTA